MRGAESARRFAQRPDGLLLVGAVGVQGMLAEHGLVRWNEEWVYNQADIDAASIVWARYLDEASNRRLLSYFAGRRAWVLDVDGTALLTPLTP